MADVLRIGHVDLARGYSSAEQQTFLLIRNLAQLGVEQYLLCRDDSQLIRKLKGTRYLKIFKVHGVSDPRFAGHFKIARRVRLIAAHDRHGCNWAFLHFMMFGVSYVPCLHEPLRSGSSWYSRAFFSWAAAVVCASQSAAQAVHETFDVKPEVIPNSVNDLKPFKPHTDRLRAQYAGRLVVGQIAPLVNRLHCQSVIIDAARLLENKIPDLIVLLLGDGDDLELLRQKAQGLPNIKFISLKHAGFIADYIAALDIYINSDKEGDEYTEQVLLDVLDLEIPVISTRIPGVSDFITHAQNGYVIKPGDPESLAQALLYMRDHPSMRRQFARGGKRTADEHRPEQMALSYYQLFKRLTAK